MLFHFNKFWVSLTILILAWLSFAFLNYEFTVVSLLASLLIVLVNDD